MAGSGLPDDWEWRTLGGANGLSTVNPRRPSLTRDNEAPTSFLPMQGVDEVEGTIAQLEVRPYGEVRTGYTYFEENDVLFAKITPSMQNGKSAIARGLIDGLGFGSTEFHVLRPKPGVLPEWLHLFVRQVSFRREAMHHFRGAVGQQRVPQEFLDSHSIPFPHPDDPARSLEIQRRIVARIEALFAELRAARELHQRMVEDTERLLNSVFFRVFDELESTSETMSELCHIWGGSSLPSPDTKVSDQDAILLLRVGELNRPENTPVITTSTEAIGQSTDAAKRLRIVPPGSVIIPKRGGAIATNKKRLLSKPAILDPNLMAIIPRDARLRPWFLLYWFEILDLTTITSGSTVPQLNKRDLEPLEIPVPDPEQQKLIVAYCDRARIEIEEMLTIQASNDRLLDHLEQAILVQALRGEL